MLIDASLTHIFKKYLYTRAAWDVSNSDLQTTLGGLTGNELGFCFPNSIVLEVIDMARVCVCAHQDRVHSHVDAADTDHQAPAEGQAEAQQEGVL